jgi:hypothetical protein
MATALARADPAGRTWLEFVNYELTNGPRIFSDTGRKLKTATTAGEAAAIFASGYERMRSDAQPAARAKIADEIFQHFFPVKKR